MLAMNQKDVLDALVGNAKYQKICGAVFVCGTPLETDVGSETLVKGNGMAEAKKLLAESGYDGTPIAVMAPGDVTTLKAQPVVAAQLLREAGFKVDLQATDWQTVVTRRASQKPVKEGGWNMFFTNWVAADVSNPVANVSVGGRGKNGGWFGWAEDAKNRAAARPVRARINARGAEEGRRRAPEGELREGDLHSARPVSGPDRMAQVDIRRARWPGDAGILEYGQVGIGRIGKAECQDATEARIFRRVFHLPISSGRCGGPRAPR